METSTHTRTLSRSTTLSDDDFDDKLDVPPVLLTMISVEGKPVLVEDDENDYKTDLVDAIPFSTIFTSSGKFKSYQRKIFVPGLDVTVAIEQSDRNLTSHFLNPNLYTITLTHGDFTWQVKRRYKHIQHLHQQLVLFRTSLNIPFPTKTHRQRRDNFKNNAVVSKSGKRKGALPRFPNKPEVLISHDRLQNRIKQLEDYLNNLLAINIYRNHPETIQFFELSHLSFIHDLGFKGQEGMVKKRLGNSGEGCKFMGLFTGDCCLRCKHLCNDVLCSTWSDRWFFIKDQCFGYIHPKTGRIGNVILFDQGFEVSSGLRALGLHTGVQISTYTRQLVINCWTRRKCREWIRALKEVAHNQARDFTQYNQRHSFAPVRNSINATWFVDGAGYMSAVADALSNAKEEIFIADWWLSPEIYLKRPALRGDYWRLDKVLQRKSEEGVKVFVLLYKEVEMAIGINSFYSKQRLVRNGNDNIKVMRHPQHAKSGVFLWAHHEKLVIVDQSIAFLGGIDLCYGRWDDSKHRLTDLGSLIHSAITPTKRKKTSSSPSGEFPFISVSKSNSKLYMPDLIVDSPSTAAQELARPMSLPAASSSLQVPQPKDFFKQNTPEFERKSLMATIKQGIKGKGKHLAKLSYAPGELQNGPATISELDDVVDDLDGSAKFWVGKDYVNFIVKDFNNLEEPFDDLVDRTTTPRMPWHDMAVCVQNATARDVARHFIQRWNAAKNEMAKQNYTCPYLLPKAYVDCSLKSNFLQAKSQNVTCQVLRSVSAWSCGFIEPDIVEQSIHEAYVDCIAKAQHYIYIENQFFISLPRNNLNTLNQIAEALFTRIVRAYKEKSVFRVYVVMPLLPAFEGEIGQSNGASIQAITHWNYASICRGKDGLLNRLKDHGIPDPSVYISFYGLRTHSVLCGEPVTELIYVHSKLMIVDDKIVICGSANINDRSLLGKRDSEVAVIIEVSTCRYYNHLLSL
uniref:Phospholipase n=4 Tax=Photinus pyralis TaxID=7054 RepID=A0A1Y1KCY0_PHOPY